MANISLEEELLDVNIKDIEYNKASIDSVINEIVDHYVTKRSEFINDIEKGVLPFEALEKELEEFIDKKELNLKGYQKEDIYKSVYNYLYKYYILQDLIDSDDITDIKVIDENNIRVKRINKGYSIKENVDLAFESKDSFKAFCNYIARRNRSEINNKNAVKIITDKERCEKAILRINLTAENINSTDCPCLTIRKIPKEKYLLDQLVVLGMISPEFKEYLKTMIAAGAQIMICGKGGSGKTTLYNAMIEEIDESLDALFIQETEELHSKKKNIIFQRIKTKASETDTEFNLQDLTRNSMVMDVDVIGVGEIKGKEAFDFFNALFSGHIGWGTIHSPSAKEAIKKLLQYIEYAGVSLSEEDKLRMLSRLDLIIFMDDFKVLEATEVEGYSEQRNEVIYNPTFTFDFKNQRFVRENETCERLRRKIEYQNYKRKLRG